MEITKKHINLYGDIREASGEVKTAESYETIAERLPGLQRAIKRYYEKVPPESRKMLPDISHHEYVCRSAQSSLDTLKDEKLRLLASWLEKCGGRRIGNI